MPDFASTRLALRLPPVRRIYDALRTLSDKVAELITRQDRFSCEIENLTAELREVRQTATAALLPQRHGGPAEDSLLDRWTEREMQSAVLRNMPFLPHEISLERDGIHLIGYAGAPDGLTAHMAFFINGRRINNVEYPIMDTFLADGFQEVSGMSFSVRAVASEHLDELKAARFWRFDASPTGHFVPAHWRQAVHFMNPAFEAFPFPPPANMKRVIGDTGVSRFAMGGATTFKNLEHYLAELGHSWADFPNILDWGCGAGRVTRYLISQTQCAVTGADIDPDNIAWCRETYHGGQFEVLPLRPPTQLPDEKFDLVLGLSVMTHLQENDQWLWLAELQRITRPGALVFLSVRGPTMYAYDRFPAAIYRQLDAQGYLDLTRDPALDDVIPDPDYYRAALHSRRYITRHWAKYFEVIAIVEAIASLQDFVVMRRR